MPRQEKGLLQKVLLRIGVLTTWDDNEGDGIGGVNGCKAGSADWLLGLAYNSGQIRLAVSVDLGAGGWIEVFESQATGQIVVSFINQH